MFVADNDAPVFDFDVCVDDDQGSEGLTQDPYDDGDWLCVVSSEALPDQIEDHGLNERFSCYMLLRRLLHS